MVVEMPARAGAVPEERVARPGRRAGAHQRTPGRPPSGVPRAVRWSLGAVALACTLCIVVFGSVVAVRAPVWAPIDEGAHFSYVQQIAEHGSLPVLGSLVSEQVQALADGTYPRLVPVTTKHLWLGSYSYEAFQPPLAYAVDVPAFYLSGNYHTKVVLLRLFDLLLLVVTVGLYVRLCRLVLGDRWLYGLAPALVVLALPGMVVRCVTVSNLPLEMVLVTACVTELWLALHRSSPARLCTAGVLVGLGLLTDLFSLGLVPLWLAVAAVFVGFGVLYSGVVDVGADDPHAALTRWLLHPGMRRSVQQHARGIRVPDLHDPAMIMAGFRHYREMCVGCHLAPGVAHSEIREGLTPRPPRLQRVVGHVPPAELFWIVKHGVKMTAMPAWGKSHSDDKLWAIVAFLEKLPGMTAAQYRQMDKAAGTGDGDEDASGKG